MNVPNAGMEFFIKSFQTTLILQNGKDEVKLSDWVDTIIIPSGERTSFESIIPQELKSKTFYLDNDCKDIWSWSEKVYELVKGEKR